MEFSKCFVRLKCSCIIRFETNAMSQCVMHLCTLTDFQCNSRHTAHRFGSEGPLMCALYRKYKFQPLPCTPQCERDSIDCVHAFFMPCINCVAAIFAPPAVHGAHSALGLNIMRTNPLKQMRSERLAKARGRSCRRSMSFLRAAPNDWRQLAIT